MTPTPETDERTTTMSTETASTVAEEIRAAAEKLRERAGKATPGPWSVDGPWWWDGREAAETSVITAGGPRDAVTVTPPPWNRHPAAEQSADWIATVHPGIAEPLAKWLESWDGIDLREDGPMPDDFAHALAVARVINGAAR